MAYRLGLMLFNTNDNLSIEWICKYILYNAESTLGGGSAEPEFGLLRDLTQQGVWGLSGQVIKQINES